MADVLAATHPDLFEAVGIHSGLPYGSAHDVVSAFAAMKGTASHDRALHGADTFSCRKIVFHGGADTTVHPSNSERIIDRVHRESPNMIKRKSETEAGVRKVTRTVLEGRDGRAMTEHWFVSDAGHAWFGGDARGSYAEADGPDASRVMVRFFLRE